MSVLDQFGVPLESPRAHVRDCFKPVPLPERRPEQTYQPLNRSWYELQFNYRIEIKVDTRHLTKDQIMFGQGANDFFRIKEELQADPERWGVYRSDWFGSVADNVYVWYFMTRDKALEFRLWVDL